MKWRNSVAMFSGANNVTIHGGSFMVNSGDPIDGLNRLLDEVAPNAILNAGGRADEVQCYPGTREDVMGRMEKWMDAEDSRKGRILWLSGPAGAGKSAIMQTLAGRCQRRGKHAANFFFFRNDMTRNRAQPLVATLVYQLRTFYPTLDNLLGDFLMATPLICKASISEQFQKLISSPIHTVQSSSSIPQPIIIIIDGLDECSNKMEQEQVLAALHALIENDESIFRVVLASRAESHIAMSFNKLVASVVAISLDDNYQPQDDIRRFVIAKFDEIKQAHPLAHTLDHHWPTPANIDAIIEKSSGQFIYAATVMRFIESSAASPSLSLLTVQGILQDVNHNPYAQLDAVYAHILSKSHNIEAIKFILGVHFATHVNPTAFSAKVVLDFTSLVHYAGYGHVELASLFADLAAIVSVRTDKPLRLVFYHASLSDYLLDKSRSQIYYVDVGKIATEVSAMCLETKYKPSSWSLGVAVLGSVNEAIPALSKCLLDASTAKFRSRQSRFSAFYVWKVFIVRIYIVYFASDRALYWHLLQHWIRFAYTNKIKYIALEQVTTDLDLPTETCRAIRMYYKWYLLTEGLKYTLRYHK